ncbi:MAG: hypothetical protein ABSC06_18615 [Rhodopila sp.]
MPIEAAERVKAAIDLPKLLDGFGEDWMQQRRGGRVEHIADVIVAGDSGNRSKQPRNDPSQSH